MASSEAVRAPLKRAQSALHERLREARRKAGLTQQEVADHLGVDRTAVTQWESRAHERRACPDISRLNAFGKLTRTSVEWLLSNAVNIEEERPEVTCEEAALGDSKVTSLQHRINHFWDVVRFGAQQRRVDLLPEAIWDPEGPAWMQPLLPSVMTPKAAVTFISDTCPDLEHVAEAISILHAFEQAKGHTFERKVVMVWAPPPEGWPKEFSSYLDKVRESAIPARKLADSLRVSFLVVTDANEAAKYLVGVL